MTCISLEFGGICISLSKMATWHLMSINGWSTMIDLLFLTTLDILGVNLFFEYHKLANEWAVIKSNVDLAIWLPLYSTGP